MSPHRFFVTEHPASGETLTLSANTSRQIARALRLRVGDTIVVFDGSGGEWPAEIQSADPNAVSLLVGAGEEPERESATRVTLSQAVLKSDNFELVLQKAIELGVAAIQLFTCERSVARSASAFRLERWQRIIREAAEQSGRTIVPELLEEADLAGVFATPDRTIMLWEEERSHSLGEALQGVSGESLKLIVGPVGGFSAAAADSARAAGAAVVGLGPRILRAETAGITAVALALYELGEMSGST